MTVVFECSHCGRPYRPSDYGEESPYWQCGGCGGALRGEPEAGGDGAPRVAIEEGGEKETERRTGTPGIIVALGVLQIVGSALMVLRIVMGGMASSPRGMLALAWCAFGVAFGVGMVMLRRWALVTAIICYSLNALLAVGAALIGLAQADGSLILWGLIGVVVSILLIRVFARAVTLAEQRERPDIERVRREAAAATRGKVSRYRVAPKKVGGAPRVPSSRGARQGGACDTHVGSP